MTGETIRVIVVTDVVMALAAGTLDDALWLVDSNKRGGSAGGGTRHLQTAVRKGDELLWTVMALECEAFVSIEAIEIDAAYCEVTSGFYEGTDIRFWRGTIREDPGSAVVPYNLALKLGSRRGVMTLSAPELPSITGRSR